MGISIVCHHCLTFSDGVPPAFCYLCAIFKKRQQSLSWQPTSWNVSITITWSLTLWCWYLFFCEETTILMTGLTSPNANVPPKQGDSILQWWHCCILSAYKDTCNWFKAPNYHLAFCYYLSFWCSCRKTTLVKADLLSRFVFGNASGNLCHANAHKNTHLWDTALILFDRHYPSICLCLQRWYPGNGSPGKHKHKCLQLHASLNAHQTADCLNI